MPDARSIPQPPSPRRAALLAAWLAAAAGFAAWPLAAQQPEADVTVPQIARSRDLLTFYDVPPAALAVLVDGRPINAVEEESLLFVLHAARDVLLGQIARWIDRECKAGQVSQEPAAHRGDLVTVRGRLKKLEAVMPANEESRARFEIDRYYRCEIALADSGQPAVVYAARVPQAWLQNADTAREQNVGAQAFFLKTASEDAAAPTPVFATRRVEWYPAGFLGEIQFDRGLFDDVRNGTGNRKEETEPFYALLAAMGRSSLARLNHLTTGKKYPLEPLFLTPDKSQGQLVALTGTARRILKIPIENHEIEAAFGFDHYYEVFLFTQDSQDKPLTFVVRQIPKNMPQGDRINVDVHVAGVMFKTWFFDQDTAEGKLERLGVPLLVGLEPELYVRQEPGRTDVDYSVMLVASLLFGLVVVGVGFGLWWNSRGDRLAKQKLRDKLLHGDQPPGAPGAGGEPGNFDKLL